MGDDDNIVETIKEEVTEAAKAVVAEVKSIAHEVADAIAEGKAEIIRSAVARTGWTAARRCRGKAAGSEQRRRRALKWAMIQPEFPTARYSRQPQILFVRIS
jgi:hypothetical protein